jgi:hypothetical protein
LYNPGCAYRNPDVPENASDFYETATQRHPRRYTVTLSKIRLTGHKDDVESLNVHAFYSEETNVHVEVDSINF